MKKKINYLGILLVVATMFSFSFVVEAKEVIKVCAYYNFDEDVNIKCNIYSNFSHSCELQIGNKKSNTESWKNYGSEKSTAMTLADGTKIKLYFTDIESYVKSTSSCPKYTYFDIDGLYQIYGFNGYNNDYIYAKTKTDNILIELPQIKIAPHIATSYDIAETVTNVTATNTSTGEVTSIPVTEDLDASVDLDGVVQIVLPTTEIGEENIVYDVTTEAVDSPEEALQVLQNAYNDFLVPMSTITVLTMCGERTEDECIIYMNQQKALLNDYANIGMGYVDVGYIEYNDDFYQDFLSMKSKVELNFNSIISNLKAGSMNHNYLSVEGCNIFGENMTPIIAWAYAIIRIAIPILVVILTILDFLKVAGTGEEKSFKAAVNKLIKRVIIVVIFEVLPILITIIIDISGVLGQYNVEGELFCSLF